jgi:hypothetical protein
MSLHSRSLRGHAIGILSGLIAFVSDGITFDRDRRGHGSCGGLIQRSGEFLADRQPGRALHHARRSRGRRVAALFRGVPLGPSLPCSYRGRDGRGA